MISTARARRDMWIAVSLGAVLCVAAIYVATYWAARIADQTAWPTVLAIVLSCTSAVTLLIAAAIAYGMTRYTLVSARLPAQAVEGPSDSPPNTTQAVPDSVLEVERVQAENASLRQQLSAAQADHALALSELESFGYSVAHDLRAPLRVVDGFARILLEDYERALDRVGRDHLQRILAASSRQSAMIEALLSLARLSAQPLVRSPLDLSSMAEQVVADLRASDQDREVDVLIEPGLRCEGDSALMRIVLDNLFSNAWKYTGKTAQAQIAFLRHVHPGEPVNCFVVQDNGAGFDMRFTDHLFGVFQRLHRASDFPGHGVGLATVARILRRHGGAIWAESAVDQGARFFFRV